MTKNRTVKDFSLFYGPARSLFAAIGAVLLAVAVGLLIQRSTDDRPICQAAGATVELARAAHRSTCGATPTDCEPNDVGGWLCSGPEARDASTGIRSSASFAPELDDADPLPSAGRSPRPTAERAEASGDESDRSASGGGERMVPFVSLKPSPNSMTEAGRDLVARATGETTEPGRDEPAATAPTTRNG